MQCEVEEDSGCVGLKVDVVVFTRWRSDAREETLWWSWTATEVARKWVLHAKAGWKTYIAEGAVAGKNIRQHKKGITSPRFWALTFLTSFAPSTAFMALH